MEPSPGADERDDSAVTVSISNRVRPGREREYEGFLRGIDHAASRFPGYLGARVFRPSRGDRQYRVVLRFERERDLRRWMESDERRAWYLRAEALIEDAPWVANITGTAQERPLALALTPLEDFVRTSVSGIGLLLLGTAFAVILASSPLLRDLRALLGD